MVAAVPAGAQDFHTLAAFAALCAVFAAGTVKTALALAAELIVGTVFTFFTASHTDNRTVGASVAAVADLLYAVFAQQAFGAVVALTAETVKANIALDAKLQLGAVSAFFTAFRADVGTL